jgi:hypothetical protein
VTRNFYRKGDRDLKVAFPESPTSLRICSVRNLRIFKNYNSFKINYQNKNLTEFYEEFPVTLSLIRRESEDAGDVIVL